MKPFLNLKLNATMLMLMTLVANTIFAQTWLQAGNSNVTDATDKVGSINCNKVELIADSITAITLNPDCNGKTVDVIFNTRKISMVGTGSVDLMGSNGIHSDTGAVSGTKCESKATGPVNAFAWEGIAVPQPGYGTGLYGEGGSKGVSGKANAGAANKSVYGIYGNAVGSNNAAKKFGVFGIATGSGINYGVYGKTTNAGSASAAGYFEGNLTYTGILSPPSDFKLKENIQPLSNALVQLQKLSAKTYTFKREYDFMNLPKGRQMGFISQEVEKVFPELIVPSVHPATYDDETGEQLTDEVSFKGLNYVGLIPVLVEAVNEQQIIIESVQKENAELKHQLATILNRIDAIETKQNECCGQNNATVKSQNSNPSPFAPRPRIPPTKHSKSIFRKHNHQLFRS